MIECICGRSFKSSQHYDMHKKHCKGLRICENPECNNKLIGDQNKFCSLSCSATITNKGRVHNEETKRKISISLGGTGEPKTPTINKCLFCENEITNRQYCNFKCYHNKLYNDKLEDWFKNPNKYKSPQGFMKKWLIEKYNNQCSICKWDEIHPTTNKVPLQLHHKDGDWTNNRPENLDLLCPNCHSLTETYIVGKKAIAQREEHCPYKQDVLGSSPSRATIKGNLTMSLEQALKRPGNYKYLSAREQWEIDKDLGILDWEPTKEDQERYKKIMKKEKAKGFTLVELMIVIAIIGIVCAIVVPMIFGTATTMTSTSHSVEDVSYAIKPIMIETMQTYVKRDHSEMRNITCNCDDLFSGECDDCSNTGTRFSESYLKSHMLCWAIGTNRDNLPVIVTAVCDGRDCEYADKKIVR